MARFRRGIAISWLGSLMFVSGQQHSTSKSRLSEYVDPLIGTEGPTPGSAIAGGNSFPGPSVPWGMAKPGIDTSFLGLPNGTAISCNAGYTPIGNITGISMTHVSGTGGVPTYGLISQMPIPGDLSTVNVADNTSYWQNRSLELETASVGLFKTAFLNGVGVEITSTAHAGWMRYTYPNSPASNSSSGVETPPALGIGESEDAHVLVDLTHVLPGFGAQSYSQKFLHGELHLRSSSNGQPSYFGSATYSGGWTQPESHTLFFCGNFSSINLEPTSSYVQQNTRAGVPGAGTFAWEYNLLAGNTTPVAFESRPVLRSYNDIRTYTGSGMGIGALFSWTPVDHNTTTGRIVESKVGISYISADQACESVERELPRDKSFEEVIEDSRKEWEEEVLGTVEIVDDGTASSQNDTLKCMLYSALYQTGLMPTDKTSENPYWETDADNPYYDDHYTLWDTYRSVMPLYHLLFTQTYSRVLKGLIAIFTNEGYLPAGRAANWNGRVQGGTHADMVIVDAYLKNRGELAADIDWLEAYGAIVKDATVPPTRNHDPATFDGATKEGRGALDDYLYLGYITRNHTRSISRGVEYSQNDFAVWSMAQYMTNATSQAEILEFRIRAGWWQNQWNAEANTSLLVTPISNSTSNTTFTGFPAPRNSDGTWNYTGYNPLNCNGCGWANDIYEATVWETAFNAAPHDMSKLIELMGGDEAFIKRLDASFLPGLSVGKAVGANNAAGTSLFNPGNEPSFMTPFLYTYIPKMHWKTANQTRATVDAFYSDKRNGYPGNIDAGAIPSWLIWNLIGLYPVSAQPIYLLGAPRFSSLRIKLFSGTSKEAILNITAPGLSETSYYPQSVSFNGTKLDRAWIDHLTLLYGGTLEFKMGPEPAEWDVGDRPPSLSAW